MSIKFLPTNQANLFFEDNAAGRMKKEIWEASGAENWPISGQKE